MPTHPWHFHSTYIDILDIAIKQTKKKLKVFKLERKWALFANGMTLSRETQDSPKLLEQ